MVAQGSRRRSNGRWVCDRDGAPTVSCAPLAAHRLDPPPPHVYRHCERARPARHTGVQLRAGGAGDGHGGGGGPPRWVERQRGGGQRLQVRLVPASRRLARPPENPSPPAVTKNALMPSGHSASFTRGGSRLAGTVRGGGHSGVAVGTANAQNWVFPSVNQS